MFDVTQSVLTIEGSTISGITAQAESGAKLARVALQSTASLDGVTVRDVECGLIEARGSTIELANSVIENVTSSD